MQSIQAARNKWNPLVGMNSDVLALYLTAAFTLIKIIYHLVTGTFNTSVLLFSPIVLALFWCCLRGVCDVLTSKGYVRRWNKIGKVIYVRKDENPVGYVLLFLLWVFCTVFVGILALRSQG